MRVRGKVDGNHAAIVEALRATGWKVRSLASVGRGMPDLLIARHGIVRLVEVKTPKGTLTPHQVKMVDEGWPVVILRSVDEALAL